METRKRTKRDEGSLPAEETQTPVVPAPALVEVTSYLLMDDPPEDFVKLADLRVQVGNKVFPCHASCLAKHSKVLAQMFASTPREGWSKGVAQLFMGHSEETLILILEMIYGHLDVWAWKEKLAVEVVTARKFKDILTLSAKLDAPKIYKICEDYTITNIRRPDGNISFLLWMLNMAGQCKFEKIYTDCKRAVLKRFLKSPDHTEFVEKMKTPGKGLGCLSENDANMLFMALLKAFHDSQKDAKRNRNVYSLQHLMVCNFDSEEYIDGLLQVLQSSERQT